MHAWMDGCTVALLDIQAALALAAGSPLLLHAEIGGIVTEWSDI